MVSISAYIFFNIEDYKILDLITYFPKVVLFSKISKNVR